MSELIKSQQNAANARRDLLAGVCAFALLTTIALGDTAQAREDESRPTVWIELGGQLERASKAQDSFSAPFMFEQRPLGPFPFPTVYFPGKVPFPGPDGAFDRALPLSAQTPPKYNVGGEGKVSFQSEDSNWVFSASVRYGRANGDKQERQQTVRAQFAFLTIYPDRFTDRNTVRFSDTTAEYEQSHTIVDFQAGVDVGLGAGGSTSTISGGVRFAQFSSKSNLAAYALPNMQAYNYKIFILNRYITRFQTYVMDARSERNFHGVGPSISWNASTPLLGGPDTAQINLDWGLNAAVLFGRQKVTVEQTVTGYERYQEAAGFYPQRAVMYADHLADRRSKSVTVPNLGGFAGLSFRYANVKVSFGYRADFFFGAMDAGIAARRTVDQSFHGPFAKLSIGLGG